MRSFHPFSALAVFIAMLGALMLIDSPFFIVVSLIGALLMLFSMSSPKQLRRELFTYILLFILAVLLNPLLVHRGSTPLLFVNGKAVTLEAAVFGAVNGLRLFSGILWCRGLTLVMNTERLFCITGKLSPRLTAILMMSVRFVPNLIDTSRKLDLYNPPTELENASVSRKIRRRAVLFSALVTRAIEDGMQTADSMSARGFELKGRSSYSRFHINCNDIALILLCVISLLISVFFADDASVIFYPTVCFPNYIAPTIIVSFTAAAVFIYPIVTEAVINFKRNEVCRNGSHKG